MSTVAVSLGSQTTNVANRPRFVEGDGCGSSLFRIRPDYRNSSLWIRSRSSSPLFVSQRHLNQLQKIFRVQHFDGLSPFKYRIFASDIPLTFSLGGDIRFFAACIREHNRESLLRYALDSVRVVFDNLSGSTTGDVCTISVVEGEAQGGGFEAALSSQIMVAERGVCFGFPEGLFGMYPGMGAMPLLKARCGSEKAREIIGSAKRWSAEDLHEQGIVDFLAEQGQGRNLAEEKVKSFSSADRLAFRNRYAGIGLPELESEVRRWVDQAMTLSQRQIKTMELILQAQDRALHSRSGAEPARVG